MIVDISKALMSPLQTEAPLKTLYEASIYILDYSRHRNSATCYQLVQSILKISSVLAERVGQGEVGGCHPLGDSARWLLQLATEKPWSAPDGPFFFFLAKTSVENGPFTF